MPGDYVHHPLPLSAAPVMSGGPIATAGAGTNPDALQSLARNMQRLHGQFAEMASTLESLVSALASVAASAQPQQTQILPGSDAPIRRESVDTLSSLPTHFRAGNPPPPPPSEKSPASVPGAVSVVGPAPAPSPSPPPPVTTPVVPSAAAQTPTVASAFTFDAASPATASDASAEPATTTGGSPNRSGSPVLSAAISTTPAPTATPAPAVAASPAPAPALTISPALIASTTAPALPPKRHSLNATLLHSMTSSVASASSSTASSSAASSTLGAPPVGPKRNSWTAATTTPSAAPRTTASAAAAAAATSTPTRPATTGAVVSTASVNRSPTTVPAPPLPARAVSTGSTSASASANGSSSGFSVKTYNSLTDEFTSPPISPRHGTASPTGGLASPAPGHNTIILPHHASVVTISTFGGDTISTTTSGGIIDLVSTPTSMFQFEAQQRARTASNATAAAGTATTPTANRRPAPAANLRVNSSATQATNTAAAASPPQPLSPPSPRNSSSGTANGVSPLLAMAAGANSRRSGVIGHARPAAAAGASSSGSADGSGFGSISLSTNNTSTTNSASASTVTTVAGSGLASPTAATAATAAALSPTSKSKTLPRPLTAVALSNAAASTLSGNPSSPSLSAGTGAISPHLLSADHKSSSLPGSQRGSLTRASDMKAGAAVLGLDDFKEHTASSMFLNDSGASSGSGEYRVSLNIGGQRFETTVPTLTRDRSMFSGMFSGLFTLQKDSTGSYFIDRDPTYFRHILNYLRDGSVPPLDALSANDKKLLLVEARYYQVSGLISLLTVDAKKVKSAHRSELSHEKEYKLIAGVQEEHMSSVFTKLTGEGYDFESWIIGKRPGTIFLLFSRKITRAELSLLSRLDSM